MTISENELRDILKIQRQLVRVIEQALRTEQEKNEDRLRQQLKNSGIDIAPESTDAFEL